jgi:uncharacterized membrane protein
VKYLPTYRYLPWVLGVILCTLVVARYVALSSNIADLGFFLANIANTDSQWQRAFSGHTQPLMLLWGTGYQALPAETAPLVLVTLQTFALLGSVVAIWRVFGAWPGVAMLLYYPLWANALFDFHFDHLAVPLLAAFFIACERRRFGWATVAAAALVLLKDPFALQTVACGLYFGWLAFYLRGSGVSMRLIVFGALLALWGGSWFYGATHWLMPYFGDGATSTLQSGAFSWLGSSLSEMIWTLVSRPDRVLAEIIGTPGKLVYLAVIFGLLAFLPLLRPAVLIVALPLLMIAMLSRLDNYYGYANHYTAGVIVPAIVAFRDGLPVARRNFASLVGWVMSKLKRYPLPLPAFPTWEKSFIWTVANERRIFSVILLAWLLAGHWAFASSPISRLFWSDKVWSYSWHAYVPTEREIMMKEAMLKYIPADPDVSVTTQNTVNWYHLAHRKVYLPFPVGVDTPHRVMDWSNRDFPGLWQYVRTGEMPPAITHDRYADYVVLDLKRPWFIIDKGCDWLYGACRNDEMAVNFLRLVNKTRQRYNTVFERDGFMILRLRTK